jgi:hypothetical protein
MELLHIPAVIVVAAVAGGTAVWVASGDGQFNARPAPAPLASWTNIPPAHIDGDRDLLEVLHAVRPATTRAHENGGRVTRYDLRYPTQGVELSLVLLRTPRGPDRWRLNRAGRDLRNGRSLRLEEVLMRFGAGAGEVAAGTSTEPATAIPTREQ